MCVCMCRGHSRDYGTRGVHNTKEMNPHISKVRNMGTVIRKTQSNSCFSFMWSQKELKPVSTVPEKAPVIEDTGKLQEGLYF